LATNSAGFQQRIMAAQGRKASGTAMQWVNRPAEAAWLNKVVWKNKNADFQCQAISNFTAGTKKAGKRRPFLTIW